MTEPKPKRVYKRRDWRKEMETLAAHCQTCIELMVQWRDRETTADNAAYWDGQVAALKNVLARIERKP